MLVLVNVVGLHQALLVPRCSTWRHGSSTVCDRTTTSLMHWQHVQECMQYKITVLTFKLLTTARCDIWDILLPSLTARSASSAVSKYQPPSRALAPPIKLNCWQPWLSCCHSSSLERSARGLRLIVIIANFPPSIKNSSFSTFVFSPDFLTV